MGPLPKGLVLCRARRRRCRRPHLSGSRLPYLGQNSKENYHQITKAAKDSILLRTLLMFCLETRFVAWDYFAAPGLAFHRGIYVQGDEAETHANAKETNGLIAM
jgi:hypothetical protein